MIATLLSPVLASSPIVASSDDACSSHHTCGGCLQEGAEACFWCHSSRSCLAIEQTFPPFQGCADVGLDAATCECRPAIYDSCGQCANASHTGCVWLDTPDTKFTVTLGPITQTLDLGKSTNGVCWPGSGFGPTGLAYNRSFFNGGLKLGVETVPTTWFWGQCRLPESTMAGLLVALGIGLLCCVTLCCHCARRRRRRAVLRTPLLVVYPPEAERGPRVANQ